MPRRCPVKFRHKLLNLIESGKPVAEIAAQLGVSDHGLQLGGPRSDRPGTTCWRVDERVSRAGGGVTAHP